MNHEQKELVESKLKQLSVQIIDTAKHLERARDALSSLDADYDRLNTAYNALSDGVTDKTPTEYNVEYANYIAATGMTHADIDKMNKSDGPTKSKESES